MKLNTKETMIVERNMALVLLNGQMVLFSLVNLKIIIFMVKECINGTMAENMRANGKTIKCMVKVHLLGPMVVNI